METIKVDDEILDILKKHAEPFKDTPNDVLHRLLLGAKPSPSSANGHPAARKGLAAGGRSVSFRPDRDYTKRRITGYRLLGKHYDARCFQDVLLGSARHLKEAHKQEFETAALGLRGTKRAYFARTGAGMKSPKDLGGGLFVETNLNSNILVGICRALLEALGDDPNDLRIEVL